MYVLTIASKFRIRTLHVANIVHTMYVGLWNSILTRRAISNDLVMIQQQQAI